MQNRTGNIASTICDKDDFIRAKAYLNWKFKEEGYGLVVTSNPVKTEHRKNGVKSIYQIAYVFPDYQGGWVIEPIAEYEDYLEGVTIYDSSDIDLYQEEFVEMYKLIRPKFKVGDYVREVLSNNEPVEIIEIDNEKALYVIHSPEAESQIMGIWTIKFKDQGLYEKI